MHSAVRVVAAGTHGEDRAAVISWCQGQLLVVADGAGGRAGGAAAATAVVQAAHRLAAQQPGPVTSWAVWLEQIDRALQDVGETTAVVTLCAGGKIQGASVGDSGAWLIGAQECIELTAAQRRKPLLGSGSALAVNFGPIRISGRLLLASDGLLKYVPHLRIQQLVRTLPLDAVPDALIDAARLPSGALHDDIAVIVMG